MGQYWKILNVDKQEVSANLGKLGEFFNDGQTNRWVGSMLIPLRALPPMPWLSCEDPEYSQVNGAPLLHLPPELLHAIGRHVASMTDFIRLAATCHLLWAVLSPVLADWVADATWAGCRIL